MASSLTTWWNLTNIHWLDRSHYKLVQRFQIYVEIWLPCQAKGNSLKSCKKTSGQISKELGTNGPRDTLYQCCSNYLTILKI